MRKTTLLDARIGRDGAAARFERTAAGIEALAGFCSAHRVELVAMAATGGYEKLPFALVWAAGIPTVILNPRAVRRFAEATGFLEETDRLDAGIIAWFAGVKRLVPQEPASRTQGRLEALVTRLHQLTRLRATQSNPAPAFDRGRRSPSTR